MMPPIQNSVACGADSNENIGWINDFISVCKTFSHKRT